MEKKTTLALLRGEIQLQPEAKEWFASQKDKWFSAEQGEVFLQEYGADWNSAFVESSQPVVQEFFSELGLEDEYLPQVEIIDYHRGSWIVEAAVIMYTTVGTAYTVLKGASKIPEIQDGLMELRDRIDNNFSWAVDSRSRERLRMRSRSKLGTGSKSTKPPDDLFWTNTTIDARPMSGLTPEKLKSHSINVSVSISGTSLVVENLSARTMEELRIGLFKSKSERNNWQFDESYASKIGKLSGGQTLTKDISEFRNKHGKQLSLVDFRPVYVDCWVQDSTGIYLFNFYLE
jgi:hypothetical protein